MVLECQILKNPPLEAHTSERRLVASSKSAWRSESGKSPNSVGRFRIFLSTRRIKQPLKTNKLRKVGKMHTHPSSITKFNLNMLWIWICVSSNSSIQQAAPFASRLALGSHGRFHHGPLHTLQLDISLTSAWQYIWYTPKDPKPRNL